MFRTFTRCATAGRWIGTFRYGFDGAPLFGSFVPSTSDDMAVRIAYCKALVYASCGSRLARDWIAGFAALAIHDSDMIAVALQHDATNDDLKAFREMLQRRNQSSLSSSNASSTPSPAPDICDKCNTDAFPESPVPQFFPKGFRRPSLEDLSPASSAHDDSCVLISPLSIDEVETVIRCFMYDAIKAALFHTPSLSPQQILHLESVYESLRCAFSSNIDQGTCATLEPNVAQLAVPSPSYQQQQHNAPPTADSHFQSPFHQTPAAQSRIPLLQSLIEIVIEENMWTREKSRVIEQPGSH